MIKYKVWLVTRDEDPKKGWNLVDYCNAKTEEQAIYVAIGQCTWTHREKKFDRAKLKKSKYTFEQLVSEDLSDDDTLASLEDIEEDPIEANKKKKYLC